MANCEMCGSETSLINTLVEGVELKVCKSCAGFGKRVKRTPVVRNSGKKIIPTRPQKEIVQVICEDYSKIIRNKREKMGLKQKELAKFLAERESVIHKMESGSYAPSIELARKLERQLSINLVEQKEVVPQKLESKKETYTIGDMIKTR